MCVCHCCCPVVLRTCPCATLLCVVCLSGSVGNLQKVIERSSGSVMWVCDAHAQDHKFIAAGGKQTSTTTTTTTTSTAVIAQVQLASPTKPTSDTIGQGMGRMKEIQNAGQGM